MTASRISLLFWITRLARSSSEKEIRSAFGLLLLVIMIGPLVSSELMYSDILALAVLVFASSILTPPNCNYICNYILPRSGLRVKWFHTPRNRHWKCKHFANRPLVY